MTDKDPYDRFELQAFIVRLGAAMNAAGEPVYSVQSTLQRVAAAYGVTKARINAYPTSLFVALGRGESATLELTTPLSSVPRLDQISALHELIAEAEDGEITPNDGLERINHIRDMPDRFGPLASIAGYAVLTIGLCLILHPAWKDVGIAAVFGALVGVLRHVTRHLPTLQVLLPVLAAFCIAAATALLVKHHWADPGLRAMIASLVVFLPGAALTTAILELTAGDMVAGASRLVWAGLQVMLLAFGIVAGIEASGVTAQTAFSSHSQLLGGWAAWLGVFVFAVGVIVSHQVPTRASWALVLVLYSAWVGQVIGNDLIGGYASGLIGAVVMTPVATLVARMKSAMPVYAMFLPGFWLLVPGALSLIGLTAVASNASVTDAQDLLTVVGSIVAVAVGVLLGTQLTEWMGLSYRFARRSIL
ncbi:MAG TPA: threonine/serine exporter family protein [Gaiellaceae bacterium]|jgi:uncharacterized membrane protein YjjP (DUF1212 family)|nr:threonine/serine exporter family protein [Gaiellaceae bacterium]